MASTNKTTNYELSQYIGTDKPTYLTDYNQDMSKIDTGIHAAKSEADTNASAIGTLSSLTTTAKNNLVAAINEVEGATETNADNISENTSNIATNAESIGTLTNLTTTAKNNLVAAANEINAKCGSLSSLTTTNKNSLVGAINEVNKGNPIIYKHKTKSVYVSTGFNSSSLDDPDTIQGYTLVGIQNFDNGFADQNVCSYAIYSNKIYFTCYSNGNFTLSLDYYEVFVRSDLIQ